MSNENPPQDPADAPSMEENPFDNPELSPEDAPESAEPAAHTTDDPGREYEQDESRGHSGVGAPSEPRRSGTSSRQAPRRTSDDAVDHRAPVVPGEILLADGPVLINEGAEPITLRVVNSADRPIQVGSHFHFAETNPALDFDRRAAWGKRLNIVSGGAVRFEPGADEDVQLIDIRGRRIALGFRGESGGPLDD
ncbi:urease subunit beta [Brachybacterium alimentarium]|uniref:urease subunit beta n=1 Tax=Brachybacterium alimentarium TaxID=47845 RepID=UPI001F53E93E|nr:MULTISPECIES: urease subunit beta [Brachybacterium]